MRLSSIAIIAIFILGLMQLAFAQGSADDDQKNFIQGLRSYKEVKPEPSRHVKLFGFLYSMFFAAVFLVITEGVAKLINRTKKNDLSWKRLLLSRLAFSLFILVLLFVLYNYNESQQQYSSSGILLLGIIGLSPIFIFSPLLYASLATYLEYKYLDIKYKKLGPLIAIIITAIIVAVLYSFVV